MQGSTEESMSNRHPEGQHCIGSSGTHYYINVGPIDQAPQTAIHSSCRPAMLYGSRVWGLQQDGAPPAAALLKPPKCLHNRCLGKVMGAYKRTPTVALERESNVPPIDNYIERNTKQRNLNTASHPVAEKIDQVTTAT